MNANQLLTFTYQNAMTSYVGQLTIGMTILWLRHKQLPPCNFKAFVICQTNDGKGLHDSCNSDEQVNTPSQGAARSLHIIFIHWMSTHAKSLLKFNLPKQFKCHGFWSFSQAKEHYHREWEQCHFCLSTPAKEHYCMLRMPSISIIWNKTVTGTQSRLTAFPT